MANIKLMKEFSSSKSIMIMQPAKKLIFNLG